MKRTASMLVVLLISFTFQIQAQDGLQARFSAESGSPLVGEPVMLTLAAVLPEGTAVTGWPQIPTDWPPFEVRSVGEVQISENSDGSAFYRQDIQVILWNVGEFQTPETTIQYELIGGGETRTTTVEAAFFSVPSVLDPQDTALRPPRPPIFVPYISPLLIAGLVAGGLFAAGLGLRYVLMRQTARPRIPPAALTPAKAALAELRHLAGRTLTPMQFYESIGNVLRVYTQTQYRVAAMDMTTWELLYALRGRLPEAAQTDLQRLLEQADLVKFARYTPDAESAQRYLDAAGRWLKTQDETVIEGEKSSVVKTL